MKKRRSRTILMVIIVLAIVGALTYAFWPQPMLVDIGEVHEGDLVVTIREEGRTQVHDAYVVSTPVVGRLQRVEVVPGDEVVRSQTIVAQMLPVNPVVLDVRTHEQARAVVDVAEAAVRVAEANNKIATADHELAVASYNRSLQLRARDLLSEATLDQAERAVFVAQAARETAVAAIAMRKAELVNAQTQVVSFDEQSLNNSVDSDQAVTIALYAPVSGSILRVLQQSEVTLPVGTPIMEIGNIDQDLEIMVELLSTDAVQVEVGDRVIVDNWGGQNTLSGEVSRIDPFGFSKFSALGVEEQRVNAVVKFTSPAEERINLGHGFRVEVQIVIWEENDIIITPAGALFRDGDDWAVFVVEEGHAKMRTVSITNSNGIEASISQGLQPGDQIVLYPSSGLVDGALVTQRLTQ